VPQTVAARPARFLLSAAIVGVVVVAGQALAASPAYAAPVPTYDSIPVVVPPSYVSKGFQATSTSEFGDLVTLGGSSERVLKTVTVEFVSWTCGNWATIVGNDCVTDAGTGATYAKPITLNVYNPANLAAPLASVTPTVQVPFRPSRDEAMCGSGVFQWHSPVSGLCHNGYAFPVTFDLTSLDVTVPDTIVVSVAYNTQTQGYAPTGAPDPANSLNVALNTTGPATIGTDVNPAEFHIFGSNSTAYGDAGAVGVFRAATGWGAYNGLVMEITSDLPTLADPPADDPGTTPAAGPQLAATGVPDYLPPAAAVAAVVVALGIVAMVLGYRKRRARHVAE
jgi:hypothetical protein